MTAISAAFNQGEFPLAQDRATGESSTNWRAFALYDKATDSLGLVTGDFEGGTHPPVEPGTLLFFLEPHYNCEQTLDSLLNIIDDIRDGVVSC